MGSTGIDGALEPGPGQSGLRRVIVLLLVNLGFSLVLTVLMFVFRNELVDYQLSHLRPPPGTDLAAMRIQLRSQVWSRSIGVLVVSMVYALLIRRLLAGKRRAYLRVIWISVAGLLGIVFLIVAGQYPVWMRIEQVAQAVVLASLLWAVTRPAVRARFRKPATAATASG
jgi:hypothetical protein